jgi:hypothetical protein
MPQANAFLNDYCLPQNRRTGHFTNRELTTIAVLAALHFAVSFAARMAGGVLYVFLGPWSTFVDGIGGEGIPCLLLAVTIALVPRVGTATYAILTVWLLNAIVSGTFSMTSMVQVSVSVVMHESILALSGVTLGSRRCAGEVVRMALAVGLANAAVLYSQFFIAIKLYDLQFPMSFVHQVSLVTGFGYGAIGAAVGAAWGRRLRRTAP